MILSEPITVREATTEDIPFVRAMIWKAIVASPTLVTLDGIETMQQYENHYWRSWQDHPDPVFVAIDATGHKLGAITIKPNDTDEPVSGWRIGIGVEAFARGQGIGKRLIEISIAFALVKNAMYVNLFVDPMNNQAIALYQRLGFVEVGKVGGLIEMRVNLNH
jgi:ribosomal protein S18 acetylase RimI-like enzyme